MRTLLASLLFLLISNPVLAQEATEAKLVKYDQLGDLIRQNKGKVIIVDLWTTTCIPCIKKFPEMLELHNKHAAEGLVIITLNVDPGVTNVAQRAATLEAIQKILSNKKLTTTNLILDEPPALAQEKLRFETVPNMYVFTREGKWWQFHFDGKGDDFDKLKQLVQEELKKK